MLVESRRCLLLWTLALARRRLFCRKLSQSLAWCLSDSNICRLRWGLLSLRRRLLLP